MPGETTIQNLTRKDNHSAVEWPDIESLPRNAKGTLICGAIKSDKKPCESPAGYRTSHLGFGRCWRHYGNTPAQNKRAAKEATVAIVHGMGKPLDVDPAEAMMVEVRRAAGNVAFYQSIIDSWSYPEDQPMSLLVQLDSDVFEKSVLMKLYGEERDRLMQYCKIAVQAGIAKQIVELATQQAMMLNSVIASILIKLGHDVADPKVRTVVAGELVAASNGRQQIAASE